MTDKLKLVVISVEFQTVKTVVPSIVGNSDQRRWQLIYRVSVISVTARSVGLQFSVVQLP